MTDYSKMTTEELIALRNQLQAQNKDVVPTAKPTAETDTTGMVGASLADMGRGAYEGGVRGAAAVFGAPGDFAELGAQAHNAINRWADPTVPVRPPQEPVQGSAKIQTNIDNYITSLLGGKVGKPESGLGKLTSRAIEYSPAMLGGKESYLARPFTRVAGPIAGEEVAGAFSKGTDAEPYARLGGALAGGPVAGRAITPFRAKDPMRTVHTQTLKDNKINATSAADRTGSPVLAGIEEKTGTPGWASDAEMNRQMTAAALRKAGAKGDTILDTAGEKKVLPNNVKDLRQEYRGVEKDILDKLPPTVATQIKGLPVQDRQLMLEKHANALGGGLDTRWKDVKTKYAITMDLMDASAKSSDNISGGHFTPKEVVQATSSHSSKPLHNLASAAQHVKSPVDKTSMDDWFRTVGLLGGTTVGSGVGNLYGLGGTGALGGGLLGSAYGPQYIAAALKGASPLINTRAVQGYLGNQAVPLRLDEILTGTGGPVSKAANAAGRTVVYSGPGRNPREEEE